MPRLAGGILQESTGHEVMVAEHPALDADDVDHDLPVQVNGPSQKGLLVVLRMPVPTSMPPKPSLWLVVVAGGLDGAVGVTDRQVRLQRPVVAKRTVDLERKALVLADVVGPVAQVAEDLALRVELKAGVEDVIRLVHNRARGEDPVVGELPVEAHRHLLLVVGLDAGDVITRGGLDAALKAIVELRCGIPQELAVEVPTVVAAGELLEDDAEADVVVVAPGGSRTSILPSALMS